MASVFQLNQFPCKSLVASPLPQFASKLSIPPLNSIKLPAKSTLKLAVSAVGLVRSRPAFRNMAVADDELCPEEYAGTVAVETEPKEVSETDSLKKELVGLFYGTDRGLKATSETRAKIVELISKLETKNPTPAPTEALTLLNGKWILAYTSFAALFPLLATGTLPLVKVEEISQTIDSESSTVQNSVQFSGPLGTSSIGSSAKFEVQSPKRVQIKFEEGIIRTPHLTDSIVFPENVEFLGQKIDLTPFNGLITSFQDTASSVAKTISSQPPLKFPISDSNAESWLLTTYLDEELRISRGDGGSVFVLIKEGSSLLTP